MSRLLTEWLFLHGIKLNEWAEACIEGSGWGWTGELCIPAEVAGVCSPEELEEAAFTRDERWTCDKGVKFVIYYSMVLDEGEALMTSPEVVILGWLDDE